MMLIGIATAMVIYAVFQIRFYLKYGYRREIGVFLALLPISMFYLVDYFEELNVPNPNDWLIFLFEPLASMLFDIP